MRRLPVIFALFAAVLLVPVAASAGRAATGDGSLVVKNGSAPAGTPVVQLTITGSVIGHVDHGRIVIDGGPNPPGSSHDPQVTGANCVIRDNETAQRCRGDQFSFRAVGGHYTVLLYGTGVDLVAVGSGSVRLSGLPDTPVGDGKYSLNGNDFVSLPGAQTDKLLFGSNS
jgi:hypothetical protein